MNNKFEYPIGSIIQLTSHDYPHCGVVVDHNRSVELIAQKDQSKRKMICKLVLIDFSIANEHPISDGLPEYTLRRLPTTSWNTSEIKQRVRHLKSKYHDSDYHIVYNNCQHFAWELATGEAKSPDASKFRMIGGLVGWAMHKKDFGSASSNGSKSLEGLSCELDRFLVPV
ncbi:lecithin retinol acyltransferase family protein [Leptolyngbya iicbica]|nr:lecithin retinol acyltransferase family protein [Leptolyngbya sp. LK]